MTFFLGTHRATWLAQVDFPLFISRRQLAPRKTLPRARCDWALDSGGFSELTLYGGWSITAPAYVQEVRRYHAEIGRLCWAPVQDYMCEPPMLQRTGLSLKEHQARTINSFLELTALAPELHWVPVLQGWDPDDYLRHVDQYQARGVDLARLSLVGLGSVCRRQHMAVAQRIVHSLQPLPLHAFGFKTTGLAQVSEQLVSADSLAWSYNARRHPPLPGCSHRNCANCLRWATRWRTRLLDRAALGAAQGVLAF